MFMLNDISLLAMLAITFAIGFGAGWWSALGSVALIIRFVLFGMSDRQPISHDEKMENNAGYSMGSFIPVMLWPSMWRWPVWRKNIQQSESVRESDGTDKESAPER